eukprot:1335848-Prymnesium_polylepis.1
MPTHMRARVSASQGRDSTCTRPPLASAGIVHFTRVFMDYAHRVATGTAHAQCAHAVACTVQGVPMTVHR